MTLRAAIFDYGMVLSGPPDANAHRTLRTITGLDYDAFEKLYWADRHAYDLGQLNGNTYWPKFARDAQIQLSPEQIQRLIESDVMMWTTTDPAMLAWVARIQAAGLRTAVLSNMGEDILRYIVQEFAWLKHFHQLTWSCELGLAKPDSAIYRHTIDKLGVPASETLFLDDKQENIEAALSLGLQAIQYSTLGQLEKDLAKRGLADQLPEIDCPKS